MRVCPKCKTESGSDLPLCAACGFDFAAWDATPVSPGMKAPETIRVDAKYGAVVHPLPGKIYGDQCHECGSAIGVTPECRTCQNKRLRWAMPKSQDWKKVDGEKVVELCYGCGAFSVDVTPEAKEMLDRMEAERLEYEAAKEAERGWRCPDCGSPTCYLWVGVLLIVGCSVGFVASAILLWLGGLR